MRFYKTRRDSFTQNDCPTSKIAIFQRQIYATLSYVMMAESQKLK